MGRHGARRPHTHAGGFMTTAPRVRPWLLAGACALAGALTAAPGASAAPALKFKPCGQTAEAASTECATATLPMDYDHPNGRKVHIAVGRVPAAGKSQGSLFFNFGGPGGAAVDYLQF